jgi:hypothetical protein
MVLHKRRKKGGEMSKKVEKGLKLAKSGKPVFVVPRSTYASG